jgi:hypothetical protein
VKLLLLFLFGAVALGLVTDRFDRWTYAMVAGGATLFTAAMFLLLRFWT